MICRVLLGLLAAALLMAAPLAAIADDIAPPPWRGAPNSVMAKFDLLGGAPGPPTVFGIGAGSTYPLDPLAPMVGAPLTLPTGELLYPISLPNFIDQEPIKYIRVQYSWFGSITSGITGDASSTVLPSPGGAVVPLGGPPPMRINPGDPLDNTYYRWDDFEIYPNPQSERFEIVFRVADPRWVVIDTISVPEPAGVLLALLGCLGLVTRRRR